jgi:hypothetical protein
VRAQVQLAARDREARATVLVGEQGERDGRGAAVVERELLPLERGQMPRGAGAKLGVEAMC